MLLAHHSGYKNKPKTFPENFLPQNLPCRINILSSLYFLANSTASFITTTLGVS